MNKKEYAESFIEAIKNKEENLYRFFTKRTIITSLNEQKNLTLDEFLIFIKENLQKEDFIIKRTFESAVCIKFEIYTTKLIELFIEIKDRRFSIVEFKVNEQ
ncbi:MAG: hypothetical protein PUA88_04315 [Bacillales bacterium]|nr:hypothetical protein [Erysipelotrichaceae bacterium]MDD6250251.1 hypothetical protein [Bacillales bacterium]MDD7382462.1 hypothetical protein [Bacillales bacterium]MDY6142013.1 hypothetical protein [Bacilli bacterium]